MPNYKHMYFALFNAVTDAVELLQRAQREGERDYSDEEDPHLLLLTPPMIIDPEANPRGE